MKPWPYIAREEWGGGGGGSFPSGKLNVFFFLTWYLSLLGYFFLYTGDPCEGARSLTPQTKNPRYGPENTVWRTALGAKRT